MGYELRKPVIILGAGGHAKVLIDALQQLKSPILGITDPRSEIQMLMGIPVLGDDDKILGPGASYMTPGKPKVTTLQLWFTPKPFLPPMCS
jgi:hypothetical protein